MITVDTDLTEITKRMRVMPEHLVNELKRLHFVEELEPGQLAIRQDRLINIITMACANGVEAGRDTEALAAARREPLLPTVFYFVAGLILGFLASAWVLR